VNDAAGWRWQIAAGAAIGLVAFLIGLELVRPFASGPVGFDSAASVIHFDRIVAGRHLEAFVTATPKPLLTVVYGVLMALADDWRAVSIATIAAFAGSVVLAGWLTWRVSGPAAAAFTVVALVGARSLLADVVIAYAVPWALLMWLVAGLAVTAPRPRPLLAGLALAAATLARLETIVLLALVAAALPVAWALERRRGRALARGWWWLLAGWLALPAMCLHDLLLTGDPLFWMSVSTAFSKAAPDSVRTAAEIVRALVVRYTGMPLLSLLALVGLAALAVRRAFPLLLGLIGLTGGIALFLVLLAARGTYVSSRYFTAIDVALIPAAAIGLAWVLSSVAAGARRRRISDRAITAALVVATGVTAVVASGPPGSLNRTLRESARDARFEAEDADRALPVLQCAVDALPGARRSVDPAATLISVPPEDVVLLVPALERPRFVRDLDLPLFAVNGLSASTLDTQGPFLPTGRLVLHDRIGDRPEEAFAPLEISAPASHADVTLVPLVADPARSVWVVAVQRPGDRVDLSGCAST
jgi:hypothetical protein